MFSVNISFQHSLNIFDIDMNKTITAGLNLFFPPRGGDDEPRIFY